MYCSKCGAQNRDDGTHCVICGTALVAPPSGPPTPGAAGPTPPAPPATPPATPPAAAGGPAPPIESYLVWAILTTLLCCLPAGVVAIIYAAQVSSKVAANDLEGARNASKNAKTWSWISFGLGLGVMLLWIVAAIISVIVDA